MITMAISRQINLFSDQSKRNVLTVSELTRQIKSCLESNIGYVWVTGEISNLRRPGSGHSYFSLKDEDSQLRGVLFAGIGRHIKFKIENGQEVNAYGRVSVYAKSGDYQIIIEKLEPKGVGALQLAFEQLKKKLEQEGLFDPARKKPIPFLPRRIGLITSPTGAAINDFLTIIDRRWPEIEVLVYPVRVQGKGSAEEIAAALKDLNTRDDIDLLILTRGGGSMEDLWSFNEEIVARQIAASRIPVVSAVGHEIDITISDLVADKRALTPSEAGELVVPVKDEIIKDMKRSFQRLTNLLQSQVTIARHRLDGIKESYAFQQPREMVRQYQQQLDECLISLPRSLKKNIQDIHQLITGAAGRLESLSPLKVLGRGYSVTRLARDQRLIKSVANVKINDEILTRLQDGEFISKVTRK